MQYKKIIKTQEVHSILRRLKWEWILTVDFYSISKIHLNVREKICIFTITNASGYDFPAALWQWFTRRTLR